MIRRTRIVADIFLRSALAGAQETGQNVFIPAEPDEVFRELLAIASDKKRFKLSAAEEFTRTATFATKSWRWKETIASQVVPAKGGATLKLLIAPKSPGEPGQIDRNRRVLSELISEIGRELKGE